MKVREQVKNFNDEAMELVKELFNKSLTPMDVMEQPEMAYVMGRVLELYKSSAELSLSLASKLDDIHDDVDRINHSVRGINSRIDTVNERIENLSKRLDLTNK